MNVVASLVSIGESVPQMKDAMAHGSDPEILVDCFGTHRRVGNLQALIIWAVGPDFAWIWYCNFVPIPIFFHIFAMKFLWAAWFFKVFQVYW